MPRLLVLAGLFLSSTLANAATWTNGTQIVEFVIWKPGYHGFYTTAGTSQDPEGCGSGRLFLLDPSLDEKTVDRLYAMLLLAHTTGKTIYIWVDGCSGPLPKFTGLQINN